MKKHNIQPQASSDWTPRQHYALHAALLWLTHPLRALIFYMKNRDTLRAPLTYRKALRMVRLTDGLKLYPDLERYIAMGLSRGGIPERDQAAHDD